MVSATRFTSASIPIIGSEKKKTAVAPGAVSHEVDAIGIHVLEDDEVRALPVHRGPPELELEDAARAVRAAEIGTRIRAGDGRLPGIRAKLYPYQVDGVAFLAGRGPGRSAGGVGSSGVVLNVQ